MGSPMPRQVLNSIRYSVAARERFVCRPFINEMYLSKPNQEQSMSLSPFHLAIPVYDLPAARAFYGKVFGLQEGRSSDRWVDSLRP